MEIIQIIMIYFIFKMVNCFKSKIFCAV